jgi:hypothetical protein
MPLIMMSQPTYFPPVFEPDYTTGEHGVINPLSGATYGAYGLTIVDYEKRSARAYQLWDRTSPKGSAYKNRQKPPPVPPPDLVEQFPPQDTRGIVSVFAIPSGFSLQAGTGYDLTLEVVVGNKTPTDLVVSLNALDITSDDGALTFVFDQTSFLLLSATEATVLLTVKVPSTVVDQRTIQIGGESSSNIMVQPSQCILDIQPTNPVGNLYQVNGPDFYDLSIGDSLNLAFTTSNGVGQQETWEFNDPFFLQTHNMTFDESSGVLTSPSISGPAGVYQVAVFVEQADIYGKKIYSSKIIEISLG